MAEPAEREPPAQDLQNIETPEQLPLLPVRDIVVFPYMVLPLFVGREMSIKAIEAALAEVPIDLRIAPLGTFPMSGVEPPPKREAPKGSGAASGES